MMENLWPQFNLEIRRISPKDILNKQILFLPQVTNYKLKGNIISTLAQKETEELVPNDPTNNDMIHSMRIYAPSLNYAFTLLRLVHSLTNYYPCQIFNNLTDEKFECTSQLELESQLNQILKNEKVKELINTLIEQSETSFEVI